jgi:hypothetical protein
MAVTVVCDEKSMVDKARECGHSLLPHKARSNDVGCYSAPSRKAREGAHPQLFGQMLKDKPAFYVPVKMAHPSDFTAGPLRAERRSSAEFV